MDPHPFERAAAPTVSVTQTAVVQQHLGKVFGAKTTIIASFEDTCLLFLQTFENEKMCGIFEWLDIAIWVVKVHTDELIIKRVVSSLQSQLLTNMVNNQISSRRVRFSTCAQMCFFINMRDLLAAGLARRVGSLISGASGF